MIRMVTLIHKEATRWLVEAETEEDCKKLAMSAWEDGDNYSFDSGVSDTNLECAFCEEVDSSFAETFKNDIIKENDNEN